MYIYCINDSRSRKLHKSHDCFTTMTKNDQSYM